MTIRLDVQQDRPRLDSRHVDMLTRLAAFAGQRIAPLAGLDAELTLRIVDIETISQLHDRYFNDPSETDIITFPAAEPEELEIYLGDIAVCYGVAAEQATSHGHPLIQELAFLLLHGMLHIAGWDDQAESERQEMLAEQERLLSQFERAGEGSMLGR